MSLGYVTPAPPLRAVVEELIRGGVRDVVICPGSRSTPLALALQAAAQLRTWVHLDERVGAFFALGAAMGGHRPAAILATSGTAVVNLAPAVTEARYGRVPLLLLTADRPPELHGIGAPQTIDQTELYGRHAKWYVELPVPEDAPELESEVRNAVSHAVDVSLAAPAGPVHVNLPFREPLLPVGPLTPEPVEASPTVAVTLPPAVDEVDGLTEVIGGARRPLIVCGPDATRGLPQALSRLAATIGAPLLADGLSNVRHGAHPRDAVVAHGDLLVRADVFRSTHLPDLVLRFGARPTSKPLDGLIDTLEVPQLLVDDGGGWERPHRPRVVAVAAVPLVTALLDTMDGSSSTADPGWLAGWRAADDEVAASLERWFADLDEPFEGLVARVLDEGVATDATVVVGNSMPVRDIDTFMPRSDARRRMLGNRGANGIDGVLSTAFGVAAAGGEPVVAIVGDLSFLHDMGALVGARRLGLDATIVLLDNDGGGIFSFLPQARAELPEAGLPDAYETLFGTPHGTDLEALVTALGATYQAVDHRSLGPALAAAVGRAGVDVLCLRTERDRNRVLHAAAFGTATAAIGGGG